MSKDTTTQEDPVVRFVRSQKAGALRFINGMKADNPQWSEEFAAGFERGVMDAINVVSTAWLRRAGGVL